MAFEASLISTHPFVPSDVRTSSDDQKRGDDACSPEVTDPPPVSSRTFLLSALAPGRFNSPTRAYTLILPTIVALEAVSPD
jgi:hypothetical protein